MSSVSSVSTSTSASLVNQLQTSKKGKHQHKGGGFDANDPNSPVGQALASLGVDQTTAASIQSQIQQAVQNATKNSSNGNADPKANRQAVEDAINGVLQKNGIDPTKFKNAIESEFKSHAGKGGPGGPPTTSFDDADTVSGAKSSSNAFDVTG